MTLPNDSITVTAGSGQTLATQSVSSKEYEAWLAAEAAGDLPVEPLGVWATSFEDTAGGLSTTETDRFSILNGDAALIVDILGAWVQFFVNSFPPVLSTRTRISRCTAHSGGTVRTPIKLDTTTGTLDADIEARSRPTSVTRSGEALATHHTITGSAAGGLNRIWMWNHKQFGMPITCRQNEGVTIHDLSEFTSGGGTAFAFGFIFRVR